MDELRAASKKRLRDPVAFLKAAVPWLSIYTGTIEARAFYVELMNCTTVQQMKAICEDHTVVSTKDVTDTNATIMAIRNAFHVAIMMYPDDESVEVTASKRQRTCSPDAVEDRVSPIPVPPTGVAADADAPTEFPAPENVRRSYRYSSTPPPPPPAKSRAKSPSCSR